MDGKVDLPVIPGQTATPRRTRRKPGRSPLRWSLALLLVAALAGGGWYGWKTWSGQDAARERVITAPVQRGDLEDAVTATGTLQPLEFVDVGTQVSGQLKVLRVVIGASVKAGDLLAEIDPTVYQSRVDADRAQLRNQQALLADKQSQLALAEMQRTRQRGLMAENATTDEVLQNAEAAVRSLTAQIEAIRAQMQQTESGLRGDEANLGYTKIYAPMSGTVASLPAKQGQTLNANQQAPTILRVADLSVMTVQAQVSEADVPKLKLGMDVYFTTLGGDQRRWYGKLRQISPTPTVVNNVVLYDALFDVPNTSGELMTQMTAQVFFIAASAKDAVFVPITALRPIGGEGRRRGAGGKAAATTADGAQGDAPKAASSTAEIPKSDGAKSDGAKSDGPRSDSPKGDSRGADNSKADSRNTEAAKADAKGQNASEPRAGADGELKSERRRGEGRFKGGEGKGADEGRGEGRPRGEGRARGEGRGGEGKGEARVAEGKVGEVRGEGRIGEVKGGEGRRREGKGGEGKGGEGRRGGGDTVAEGPAARKGGGEFKGSGTRPGRSEIGVGTDPRSQFANGRAMVRVAKDDGTFEDREVRIGMMNRVSAQILAGLQPGEQVQIGVRGPGASGGAQKGSGAPKFAPRI